MKGLPRRRAVMRSGLRALLTVTLGPVLGALAAAACHPRAATPGEADAPQLTLRLLMRTPAGTERPVEPAQPVFAGDQLALSVTADGIGHLYVLTEGTELEPLMEARPTEEPLRVPAEGWLPVDGPLAIHRVVLVASAEPLEEDAVRARVEAARRRADPDERIVAIDPAYAAHRRPGGTEIAGPRRTFRLRGPWLAEDSTVGGMRSESNEGDGLVVELRIQTER